MGKTIMVGKKEGRLWKRWMVMYETVWQQLKRDWGAQEKVTGSSTKCPRTTRCIVQNIIIII